MAEIKLRNISKIGTQIKKAISKKVGRIFLNGQELLNNQAKKLQLEFATSSEFEDIKTQMVGEFGFTPQEVAKLDRILDLMVPGGNDITTTQVKIGPGKFLMELNWVDFSKLKTHEFAQHELTKLDKNGNVISVTDIISWVEWLEEGETFRGFQFVKSGGILEGSAVSNRSRSGEGLMREVTGGVFAIEPTRVFEIIAKSEKGKFMKQEFKRLVKKSKKIFEG